MSKKILFSMLLSLSFFSCAHKPSQEITVDALEPHFKSLKQLTFEGTHAEAYFSPDGQKIIYQGHTDSQKCDQIFTMNRDGTDKKKVSANGGRNTCSFFINPETILFSSTQKRGASSSSPTECPKERDRSKGYVWEIYKDYDIYTSDLEGNNPTPLTTAKGYDAESTVCGDKITFTSARKNNSLAIYTMNTNGSNVRQLTSKIGYSGGPFFSNDCKKIVFRAYYPESEKDKKAFQKAVHEGYIPPSNLEIWMMDSDGKNKKQLTHLNASSFAPSFFADGKHVIFSSNGDGKRIFHLFSIPTDKARQPKQITHKGTFNGFPMFSADGKWLLFASNRNSENPHQLQIFLAEWAE